MKFSCEINLLAEAVTNVALAITARKTNIAALEGILLECEGNELRLTGYDLEMAIIRSITVNGIENGTTIITSSMFCEMLKKMEGPEIRIECNDKNIINVEDKVTTYSIVGIDKDEYPKLPDINEEASFQINGGRLKEMINRSIFAAAGDFEQTPILCGAMFNIESGILNVIAVDGYRVAITREKIKFDNDLKFIVPSKTLKDITKLIISDDEIVTISLSKRHAYFKVSKYFIISRLLEGDFIDYKAAIPHEENTIIELDTSEFIRCIERISIIVTQKVSVLMHIEDNNIITVESESTLGSSKEKFTAKIKGENVQTIAYNNRYMIDALRHAEKDIKIVLNGPISPIKIEPITGDDFLYLVLPVRLKSQL